LTKCYMCENEGTSNEHVPPKCLFPEMKDSEGVDYRSNLITVKSCDEHNTQKSNDDEYLKEVIVMHYANESKIQSVALKKILRAYQKQPGKFFNLMADSEEVSLDGQKTFIWTIDLGRFESSIAHIAHGLFFHHHKKHWPMNFKVFSLSLLGDDEDLRARKAEMFKGLQQLLDGASEVFQGKNPEIFKYRLCGDESFPIFYLVFYGGFEVYAYSSLGSDNKSER